MPAVLTNFRLICDGGVTEPSHHWSMNDFLFRVRGCVMAAVLLAAALPAISKAQSFPPAWSSSATYAAGDIVQYGGNWYRAMKALNSAGPYPAAAYGDWELNYVRSNTTLLVGAKQSFANLQYAWQFARNARIADAAYLHFNIVTLDGALNERFDGPLSLDHGSGALISLMGDDNLSITLSFPSTNGLVIDSGHSFGSISGITISGAGSHIGFTLSDGASVANLAQTSVNSFATGIYATQSSALTAGDSVTVNECNYGIAADFDADIVGLNIDVSSSGASGDGLTADHNASISDIYGVITNSGSPSGVGASAEHGGVIDVSNGTISGWVTGCSGYYGGQIVVTSGTLNNNVHDLAADYNGEVYAKAANLSDGMTVNSADGAYIFYP